MVDDGGGDRLFTIDNECIIVGKVRKTGSEIQITLIRIDWISV
jgi:hypothetical protein